MRSFTKSRFLPRPALFIVQPRKVHKMSEKAKVKVVSKPVSPRSWSREMDEIDPDILECFANTRNMVRGYGF